MNDTNVAPLHRTPSGESIRCQSGSPRGCRICRLIDRSGPHYRQDYRRLFHPGEFGVSGATPCPEAQAPPAIPLTGDLVSALTERIGADRAARWIASKLGTDCGCAARREKINQADRTLRKWLGLGSP